jgi:hypothetical protein
MTYIGVFHSNSFLGPKLGFSVSPSFPRRQSSFAGVSTPELLITANGRASFQKLKRIPVLI